MSSAETEKPSDFEIRREIDDLLASPKLNPKLAAIFRDVITEIRVNGPVRVTKSEHALLHLLRHPDGPTTVEELTQVFLENDDGHEVDDPEHSVTRLMHVLRTKAKAHGGFVRKVPAYELGFNEE